MLHFRFAGALRRVQFALTFAVSASVASAFAAPWFDAGVSGYESWPSDGSDLTVQGAGTWSGTASASLSAGAGGSRLSVDASTEAPLGFTAAVSKSIAGDRPSITTTIRFSYSDEPFPISPEDKALVTVATVDGVPRYLGLGADVAGGTNKLHVLSGPAPVEDTDVELGFSFKEENGATYVRYSIDGTVLTLDSAEWIRTFIPAGDGSVSSVCFAGAGEVASLAGTVEAEQAEFVVLTVPEIDHVTVRRVAVAGVEVTPNADGTYSLEKGSVVTVTFAPAAGYAIDTGTMTFVASQDMTLPAEGRPVATDVQSAVTINEVMAKNGVTLKTRNGYEGLDWVELANHGDDPIDLAGWFFYNDPTAKTSKWTTIQGSCVVPAHGYKVVWCDKDEVCPDSGFASDEAYVRFNVTTDSDSGKVLFLANTDGEIFNRLPLPGGIKDISYGLGHLSRTVVSATAAAQYKVGEGEWKSVAGPAGMSTVAGGFRTVEYKVKRQVSNMDVAEACLADPSTWTYAPATNTVQSIAFGSGGTFDASLYSNFPTYNADDIILVATGTLVVPTAGDWSFSVGSDDGFSARLLRLGSSWAWESRGARGYAQSVASFNLEAGAYEVEIVYFNRGGGRVIDFSAAKGRVEFDKDVFSIVGTAGCPVVHGGALLGQIAADVKDEMLGKETTLFWKTTFNMAEAPAANDSFRLLMRYTDGFTATLNGETVVTVPQPASRTAEEALVPVAFVIPGSKVTAGANTLEIVSVNNAIDDTELLVAPVLKWDAGDDEFVYSTTPTPGAPNAADGRTGFTPKVAFSEPHGYKDAAFELSLSCPGHPYAVIYYTLDGTSPLVGSPGTFRYTGPFEVSKTTVVRAAVPDADSILQQDTSATYLFLEEIIAAGATPPDGFPADKAVNSQAMRYGMSTAITESEDEDTQLRLRRGFTNGVRTVSLVIDPKHLFDKTKGIYVNATGNGREWERPVQVEQINPTDSADEFNVPAGIRIRGAFSRGSGYPKHSFRLFFRSEYGMGTLKHALFGDEGVGEFEKIDLRTEQNYAWSNNGGWETFVHEVFARDSQRDMGECYNRSRYYHLFINGVYWGLYQTEERVDQNYAESYGKGAAANYDVVRTSQPGYNTGVVEGESAAWENLWRITTQEGYGDNYPNNYNLVRGLNPDGTRNPDLPVYVNVTNLIVHMLTSQFAADTDAPANTSGMANNLAAFRCRVDGSGKIDGFVWNRHDAEHSLSRGGGYDAGTGALLYGTRGANHSLALGNFNPAELHYELCANAEYRRTFADLVNKHILQDGGALTAPVAEARFRARMAEIDDAIVCESARWGGSGKTRATWLNNCNDCINFINRRAPYLIAAYRELGWYPSVDASTVIDGTGAPVAEGATIAASDQIYLTVPAGGTAYYTTDGSDPRTSATAIEYSGASPVPVDVPVIAKGDVWKYSDAGEKPAENWTAPDYDDSSWSSGASRLGFASSGTFGTTLNRYVVGGSSGTQVTTYYFRRTFTMPSGAESMTSLKAALDCDDGYIAYVNGTEVGRDQVDSTEYSAFSTKTNMGEKDAVWTFPAGTLVEGENVIAVEVHQCNATSTDAWWDLALSYAAPGNVEGGISVPPTGLALAIAVFKDDEWSPITTLSVKGEMPKSTPEEGLRFVEALTAALGGDDTLDYLVVTNVAAGEIELGGVKIVAWNAKKKSEADPSLTYTFPAGASLLPGASLKIEASAFPAGGKLTNSQVGLRIYSAENTLVQDVYLDAGWWNGACDETGEHFIAKTFGAEAKEHSDWKPSATAFSANVRVLEMYTSTAGEGGDTGEFIILTNLDASVALDLTDVKLVAWNSKKKSEADPSLTIVLDDVSIPAGGTLTLDQATYFGDGKLTNSKVGLKIYDPAESCAQEVEVDASWWSSACDGTGEYFVALEFSNTVKTVSQWTHQSSPAPADWPADPDTEITSTTTASDLGITSGAFTNATPAELRRLSKWAKANSVPYAGAEVNGFAFAETGYTLFEEAYLLNCASTAEAVAAKKALFRFTEIIPGTVPSITGDFNGTVTILKATTLENGGDWAAEKVDPHFFKAMLTR